MSVLAGSIRVLLNDLERNADGNPPTVSPRLEQEFNLIEIQFEKFEKLIREAELEGRRVGKSDRLIWSNLLRHHRITLKELRNESSWQRTSHGLATKRWTTIDYERTMKEKRLGNPFVYNDEDEEAPISIRGDEGSGEPFLSTESQVKVGGVGGVGGIGSAAGVRNSSNVSMYNQTPTPMSSLQDGAFYVGNRPLITPPSGGGGGNDSHVRMIVSPNPPNAPFVRTRRLNADEVRLQQRDMNVVDDKNQPGSVTLGGMLHASNDEEGQTGPVARAGVPGGVNDANGVAGGGGGDGEPIKTCWDYVSHKYHGITRRQWYWAGVIVGLVVAAILLSYGLSRIDFGGKSSDDDSSLAITPSNNGTTTSSSSSTGGGGSSPNLTPPFATCDVARITFLDPMNQQQWMVFSTSSDTTSVTPQSSKVWERMVLQVEFLKDSLFAPYTSVNYMIVRTGAAIWLPLTRSIVNEGHTNMFTSVGHNILTDGGGLIVGSNQIRIDTDCESRFNFRVELIDDGDGTDDQSSSSTGGGGTDQPVTSVTSTLLRSSSSSSSTAGIATSSTSTNPSLTIDSSSSSSNPSALSSSTGESSSSFDSSSSSSPSSFDPSSTSTTAVSNGPDTSSSSNGFTLDLSSTADSTDTGLASTTTTATGVIDVPIESFSSTAPTDEPSTSVSADASTAGLDPGAAGVESETSTQPLPSDGETDTATGTTDGSELQLVSR